MKKLVPGIVFISLALTACGSAQDEFKVADYKACLENAYDLIKQKPLDMQGGPAEQDATAQKYCAYLKP